MATITEYRAQNRRDTAAQLALDNPVLASGEFVYETDTNKGKLGDGSTAWNSLPYFPSGAVTRQTVSISATGSVALGNADLTVFVNTTAGDVTISFTGTANAADRVTFIISGGNKCNLPINSIQLPSGRTHQFIYTGTVWEYEDLNLVTIIEDQKTSGTAGGGSSVGQQTRVLNTKVIDEIGIDIVTTPNHFPLVAGTYEIDARAPAYTPNRHKIRLYDSTNTAVKKVGESCYSSGNVVVTHSELSTEFTLTASATFRIEHYIEAATASNGLGIETSSGDVEIYTRVKIVRLK